ncbi:MFS transporter [Frankia sp. AiPs1]
MFQREAPFPPRPEDRGIHGANLVTGARPAPRGDAAPRGDSALRGDAALRSVSAAYAAQGAGYAMVVTALPSFKDRFDLGDAAVSAVLLGTCLAAAGGSLLADAIATRRGSRRALCTGLAAQAVALLGAAVAPNVAVFVAAIAVYGVGLGVCDASAAMQGVLVQTRAGTPLLGRLYATNTAAAIAAALIMAGLLALGAAVAGLLLAAVLATSVMAVGARRFDPSRGERPTAGGPDLPPLPRRGIWTIGALVFAAFVIDSAVSTWSTVYLDDGLRVTAAATPLGYAAYQATLLLARLATDPASRRLGRLTMAAIALGAGITGCAVVAAVPHLAGAVVGFAAAGLTAGILVPLAFGAAGELLPARGDEIIARVNLFNYGGAVTGAVLLGLVATGPDLGVAFLLPAAVLALVLPLVRRIGSAPRWQLGAPA